MSVDIEDLVRETTRDDVPWPKDYDGKKKTVEIYGMGVIYFKKEMNEGDNLIDFCSLVENLTTLKIDRQMSNARSLVAYGTKWEMEAIKSHPQVEHVVFERRDVPSCIYPAMKTSPPVKTSPPKTGILKEYSMYIKDYALKLGLDWCLVVLSRIKLDSLKFSPIFESGTMKVYGNENDIAKLKTHFMIEKIEPLF